MDTLGFFLVQHAQVHASEAGGAESYFDRTLAQLTESEMRARPVKGTNSIVWLLWHMARTEDVAVNPVITAGSQVLDDDWASRMKIPSRTQGTGAFIGQRVIVGSLVRLTIDSAFD